MLTLHAALALYQAVKEPRSQIEHGLPTKCTPTSPDVSASRSPSPSAYRNQAWTRPPTAILYSLRDPNHNLRRILPVHPDHPMVQRISHVDVPVARPRRHRPAERDGWLRLL